MKIKLLLILIVLGLAPLDAADKLPWLQQEGTKIVDTQGNTILLRGVNLGGWLVEEMWMMPFRSTPKDSKHVQPISDHVSLWKTIEMRFGQKKMQEIRHAYRHAWIQEGDFAQIAQLGLNVVRLPFLYDLLEEETGFYWLDRAIDQAAKHNLYVILDMHGVPGRQSKADHTGEANRNQFFSDPEMVKQCGEIWKKIAERYRDCPTVAGYDLVNEPMGAPNTATLYVVQDQVYRQIRSVDSRHLVFIEDGYKGVDRMPFPKVIGWQNVVLSSHSYSLGEKSEQSFERDLQEFVAAISEGHTCRNAPFYLGELNLNRNGSHDKIKKCLLSLQAKEISWSLWTYKLGNRGRNQTSWGYCYPPKKFKRIDPFSDTASEMLKKIKLLASSHFKKNSELAEVFRDTKLALAKKNGSNMLGDK